MYPRFQAGESILYDRRPLTPAEMVDRLAIVQLLNGDRLVKTLRPGRRTGRWRLESHNAPPLEDQDVLMVWRIVGLLTA